jgi:cytosine permease
MATEPVSPTPLPAYLQFAQPNPLDKRGPGYLNTAPTYAGVFLWFVFWDSIATHGLVKGSLWLVLFGVLLGGIICHVLFYLVPGLLGMKTGLPLYIVGTSTFGAVGGLLMPGFLMGLLQFGWLGVNTFASSKFLAEAIVGGSKMPAYTPVFIVLCILFAAGAAFIGLKGIQYVAKVATFLPLIPLAVLILALVQFGGSALQYEPPLSSAGARTTTDELLALLAMAGIIVAFFATAGAAGVDFGMNNRNSTDVNMGGIVGILVAILVTAGVATLAVAGAHVEHALPNQKITQEMVEKTREDLQKAGKDEETIKKAEAKTMEEENYKVTNALRSDQAGLPGWLVTAMMIGLTIAAFPGACFSSFIAANSFKTVMPQVNSFLSVGVGALVSILLAITGVAGDLKAVFGIIGASFGPICGAMCVDYLLAGCKWSGPRAGFNPAGWVSWVLGFVVGIMPNLGVDVPVAPVLAFVVGAVVYFVLAKIGLQSRVLPYAPAAKQQA